MKKTADGSSLPVLELRHDQEADTAGSEDQESVGARASDADLEPTDRSQLEEPGEDDEYDDGGVRADSASGMSESGSDIQLTAGSRPPSIAPPPPPASLIPIKHTKGKLKRADSEMPTSSPMEAADDGEADDSSIGSSGKIKRKRKQTTGSEASGSQNGSPSGSPPGRKSVAGKRNRRSDDINAAPLPPELTVPGSGGSGAASGDAAALPPPLPAMRGSVSMSALSTPSASPPPHDSGRKGSVSGEEDDAPPPTLSAANGLTQDLIASAANFNRRTSLSMEGFNTLRETLDGSDNANTSPSERRKQMRRRQSTKGSVSGTIKRKAKEGGTRPKMMDNIIRIVKSMYDNRDNIDPQIFLIEAKEYPENVIYVEEDEEATDDYNVEFPAIKAATVEKLILALTPEGYADPDFNFAFLLNYKSFLTPQKLVDLLKVRWTIPLPQKASKTGVTVDLDVFTKKKLTPIRLRIINIIKLWLDEHRQALDAEARGIIEKFIQEVIKPDMAVPAVTLLRLVKESSEPKHESIMFDERPPKPYLPMNIKSGLSILDIHPEEIARQLTLIDSGFYRKIKPGEFLASGWTKSDKEQRSPSILAMINSFNVLSRWVSTQILTQTDLKSRAITLNRIICIAQHCYEYNNFNGVMEVIASLHNSAIHRLYQTWEMLPQRALDMFNFLSDLMNSNAGEGNFFLYRNALRKVVPPLVPYLGVYLTDLIFLNDGNKDYVDEQKKMVNFHKMAKIARVVRTISTHQQTPYCLAPVEFIQDFLTKSPLLTDDEQYVESCKLEKKVPKAQRAQAQSAKPAKKIKVDFKALGIHFEDD